MDAPKTIMGDFLAGHGLLYEALVRDGCGERSTTVMAVVEEPVRPVRPKTTNATPVRTRTTGYFPFSHSQG